MAWRFRELVIVWSIIIFFLAIFLFSHLHLSFTHDEGATIIENGNGQFCEKSAKGLAESNADLSSRQLEGSMTGLKGRCAEFASKTDNTLLFVSNVSVGDEGWIFFHILWVLDQVPNAEFRYFVHGDVLALTNQLEFRLGARKPIFHIHSASSFSQIVLGQHFSCVDIIYLSVKSLIIDRTAILTRLSNLPFREVSSTDYQNMTSYFSPIQSDSSIINLADFDFSDYTAQNKFCEQDWTWEEFCDSPGIQFDVNNSMLKICRLMRHAQDACCADVFYSPATRFCDMTSPAQQYVKGSYKRRCHNVKNPFETRYGFNKTEPGEDLRVCWFEGPEQAERAKQIVQYTWQPETCALRQFNPHHFAQIIKDKKILFFGDSLMSQVGLSLRYMLHNAEVADPDYVSSYYFVPSYLVVNWTTHDVLPIDMIRTCMPLGGVAGNAVSKLTNTTYSCPKDESSTYGIRTLRWPMTIEDAQPDIIFFNFAHHIHHRDPSFSHYGTVLRNVLKFFAQHSKAKAIIHMSTVPGVLDCGAYHVPSSKIIVDDHPDYAWNKPIEMEHMWVDIVAKEFPELHDRFHLMNVTGVLGRRPDARYQPKKMPLPDCLHICVPGPFDDVIWLLYNTVAQIFG
eukprot:TRINITY_DN2669_c0_g2::TRINITY_DN2669_c0_g2_i1::g.26163::m.26163 TRINITY_DN2669_c0_g2::TRINITY_DN2669_c0_g2_i1::g.26163  ORF type:complete len:623 (+),score=68.54,sp/O82509/TBL23_ARATH/24.92/9e-10,PC-Esterase/PF13839.1/7.8e-09 TRINITY_DN2669_c0_g2_i1:46-1914(+)